MRSLASVFIQDQLYCLLDFCIFGWGVVFLELGLSALAAKLGPDLVVTPIFSNFCSKERQ